MRAWWKWIANSIHCDNFLSWSLIKISIKIEITLVIIWINYKHTWEIKYREFLSGWKYSYPFTEAKYHLDIMRNFFLLKWWNSDFKSANISKNTQSFHTFFFIRSDVQKKLTRAKKHVRIIASSKAYIKNNTKYESHVMKNTTPHNDMFETIIVIVVVVVVKMVTYYRGRWEYVEITVQL